MLQLTFGIFLVFLGVFGAVMIREPRSLWSGASFFLMLLGLAPFLLFLLAYCSAWLSSHGWAMFLLVALAAGAGLLLLAFPVLLLLMFAVEGIRVLRHEGLSPSNLLSLAFAALWFGFLFIWPLVGTWELGSFGTALYIIVSLSAFYLLFLMAMYALSALLNLFHLRKKRGLDYIIVLGSGLAGDRVTPLLAGRINKGIALLEKNPRARLILSGGQGPDELLPEGDAMAAYAAERGVDPSRLLVERRSMTTEENLRFSRALMEGERPRVAVVTTAYHVFRALVLARKQGMRCIGFGAKTKWYFTLNAVLREFAAYLNLTRRRHIGVIGAMGGSVLVFWLLVR